MGKKEDSLKNSNLNEDEIVDNETNTSDGQNIDKDEYIAKLTSDLVEQRKKTDEYYDHLKRNMAEFDNYKKRISKEKDAMYGTITSDVVSEILPIIDNFEKAMSSDTSDKDYKNGIEMIYNDLLNVLNKLGVVEIEAIGKEFDPNFHEAVMHIEDDTKGEKEIIEVFRKGYKINDKVIRHSMVKVAN